MRKISATGHAPFPISPRAAAHTLMSEWVPPRDRTQQPRTIGPSRAQVLLRVTTLGLMTAGSWIRATLDEYVPRGTILQVNGAPLERDGFIEAFARLQTVESPVFQFVSEVEPETVCEKVSLAQPIAPYFA